jgi:hypothetical protein
MLIDDSLVTLSEQLPDARDADGFSLVAATPEEFYTVENPVVWRRSSLDAHVVVVHTCWSRESVEANTIATSTAMSR